jgi:hypothetical protein
MEESSRKKFGYFCNFPKKLHKVKYCPKGENSPNHGQNANRCSAVDENVVPGDFLFESMIAVV